LARTLDNELLQGWMILTVTFLFVALVPFIGPLVVVLTPLPVLYYASHLGRLRGFSVLAASFLTSYGILSLLKQPVHLPTLLMIAITGLLLSEVLKRNYSFEKTILTASLFLFFCGAAFIILRSWQADIAPWKLIERYAAALIKENIELYSQLNISQEQIKVIRENTGQITRFFAGVFPALGISGSVLMVWANLLAGQMLLRVRKFSFPEFGDLTLWKAPEWLVWTFIAAGGMLFFPGESIVILGMNLLIILCMIYMFQGLAITAFFFRKKQIPRLFRFFFYGLILIQQYMLLIVVALGLFDLWVDFRKRIKDVNHTDGNQ
jgi:uncharacterized protein YybS (DUF2232 family)